MRLMDFGLESNAKDYMLDSKKRRREDFISHIFIRWF